MTVADDKGDGFSTLDTLAMLEAMKDVLDRATQSERDYFEARVAWHQQRLKNQYEDEAVKREVERRLS